MPELGVASGPLFGAVLFVALARGGVPRARPFARPRALTPRWLSLGVLAAFEEVVSRGLVLTGLAPALGPAAALLISSAGFAAWHAPALGKTQAAARVLLEWAVEQPATYLVARSTYRSLKDSTEKALLFGDGGLPPLIPPELVGQYRSSDELVSLRSGGELLFRSLEEGQVPKILNLSLAGCWLISGRPEMGLRARARDRRRQIRRPQPTLTFRGTTTPTRGRTGRSAAALVRGGTRTGR